MDSWSLFFTNLTAILTAKDLYAHFLEAGVVFDAFVPSYKQISSSRGFGFVRFKIEWDVKKSLRSLHGCMIGSRSISVQMAKHVDLQQTNGECRKRGFHVVLVGVTTNGAKALTPNARIVDRDDVEMKGSEKEISDSSVATSARLDVEELDIEEWLRSRSGVVVSAKRLNRQLFWFQRCFSTLFRLDRWTELGPNLMSSWIQLEGIPQHAWTRGFLGA